MGLFSFLFAPPPPTKSAPRKRLRRFAPMTTLPPSDYTVIDLETTGLDACACEILEIGAVRFRQHKEVSRFHSYIRPEGAIPPSSSKIHHITWSKVYNAPSLLQASSSFFDFIDNDILLGYNIEFDIKFLQTRLETDINNKSFDVLPFVRSVVHDVPNYKLETVKRYFGIVGSSHSAISDCIVTAQVFQQALHLPSGQAYVKMEQENEAATAMREAKLKEEHLALMSKRATVRLQEPSKKELHAISKNMKGDSSDYFSAVLKLLQENGFSSDHIKISPYPICGTESMPLLYEGRFFFAVKSTGLLRYILLPIPPVEIKSDFICTQSSVNEGVSSSRIYLHSTEDLEQIKAYIIAAYQAAVLDAENAAAEEARCEQEFKESIAKLIYKAVSEVESTQPKE